MTQSPNLPESKISDEPSLGELRRLIQESHDSAAKVSGSSLLAGEKCARKEQEALVYTQACITLRGLFCALYEFDKLFPADRVLLSIQPEAADRELEQMRERKDAAYLERNQVVAALAKCFPSGIARTAIEGWSEDWHGCVYIDLPTGQASWHFHDSHAYLFDGLPPYTGTWDGHDTPEKYARLSRLAASPVPTGSTQTDEKLTALLDAYAEIAHQNGVEFVAGSEADLEGELAAKRAILAYVGVPTGSAPTDLSEDDWIDLASRHANGDWNSAQPDGFLNCVKALCNDFARTVSPPGAEQAPMSSEGAEIQRLRAGLQWYADGNHFALDDEDWDTCSGESQNWLFGQDGGMLEDGTIASAILAGGHMVADDEDVVAEALMTPAQYHEKIRRIEVLVAGDPNPEEPDGLELLRLSAEVERYEKRMFPIATLKGEGGVA